MDLNEEKGRNADEANRRGNERWLLVNHVELNRSSIPKFLRLEVQFMVDEEPQPAKSELEKLLEELLSTENELEPESILLALNPAGFDQEAFNRRLKARLELEAQRTAR